MRGLLLLLGSMPEPRPDLVDDFVHRRNECILPTPVQTLSLRRDVSRIKQPLRQHPLPLPNAPVAPLTTAATAAAVAATAATDAATSTPGLQYDRAPR